MATCERAGGGADAVRSDEWGGEGWRLRFAHTPPMSMGSSSNLSGRWRCAGGSYELQRVPRIDILC